MKSLQTFSAKNGAAPKSVIKILKNGGVGIIPTDTIYGIVGRALDKKTVRRIYKLRRRDPKKPMIILVSSLAQLKSFGVMPDKKTMRLLKALWSRKKPHPYILKYLSMLFAGGSDEAAGGEPTSAVLSLKSKSRKLKAKFRYLHRGTNSLAFRLPKPAWLRKLLGATGPLVAPSANPEGRKPAQNIAQAKKYFQDGVDFYLVGGATRAKPSKLVRIDNGKIAVLRK